MVLRGSAFLLACAYLSGCHIAGYAAAVYGDPPVPAAYIPAKLPMLVIVIDPPDPAGLMIESDQLAARIEQQLRFHSVAPIVQWQHQPEMMTPQQLGRAAGADQVLVVQILSSSIDSDGTHDVISGRIATSVCLVDTTSGNLLWPTDGSHAIAVSYSSRMSRTNGSINPASFTRTLHTGMAEKIGRLFYAHTAD